jgi:P27 family predicted phage terminase small subunit
MKRAPMHLTKKTKEWFNKMLAEYELEEHHLKILVAAAESLDRIDEARETVEKEGAYFQDRFDQPKAHPALSVEKDNKVLFARLIRELNLDIEEPDVRPPRLYG